MTGAVVFRRFVSLDERDAPGLIVRMSNEELPVDGERYGVRSRLIADPGAEVADLAAVVIRKLCGCCAIDLREVGAVVISSRIHSVQDVAQQVVDRLGVECTAHGMERACSGFPAATELAAQECDRLQQPVVLVTAEIISRNINWEPAAGEVDDHRRARGQAAKLFGDGAAAVLLEPSAANRVGRSHQILDAWAGDVPDEDQLIQKIDVVDSMDPWGRVRPGTTTCMSMPGRRGLWLVRRAPQIMFAAVQTSVERARAAGRIDADEAVTHVVPHQPNGLILSGLQKRFANKDNLAQVWNRIEDTGNTVSASIPLAMAEVQDELPAGAALVAMPSVGAGGPGYRPDVLSTGCVLIRMGGGADEADGN